MFKNSLPLASASRRILTAGFAALLALIVIITLLGTSRINTINERIEAVVDEQNLKFQLLEMVLDTNHQRHEVMNRLLEINQIDQRETVQHEYSALAGRLQAALDQFRDIQYASEEERGAVIALLAAAKSTDELHDEVVAITMRPVSEGAVAVPQNRIVAAQERFQIELYHVLDVERRATLEAAMAASRQMREAWLLVAVAGMLLLLLGAGVSIAVIRQISRSENELHREKELAEVTLHSIGDGVITTDAEGRIDYMNPIAERYTGWGNTEARGLPLAQVYQVLDEQTGKSLDYTQDVPTEQRAMTVKLTSRDGTSCAVRDSYAPIHNRDGVLVGRVVVFHDVSQIQEMAQQLSWQATHDALTELINRREFERRLADLIESAQGTDGKQHAMLFMDLDNFKTVNDTCGHVAGDELLRQLTTVMLSKMRGSDTLARVGGDEFGALLESCPLDQAVRIANGMREAVRDFRFIWQDKTFGVGVSIGLVPIDSNSGNVSRMLAIADAICYEAKSKGRDRVQVYHPKDGKPGEHDGDLQMVSQINHAFELGNFQLYRQKIIALNSAPATPHYEVLVRMVDREGSLIPPSGFMAAAERFNLLSSIERWVISSLVEYLHRQHESGAIAEGSGAVYAVNLSGASINDGSFPDFVGKLLTRFQLPRGLLCFEVTETTAISNLSKAAELMQTLKAQGCRFALDDFGVGMSSFAYLKYLPVDYIKIDGTFIRDMATDPMDHAIVEAINRIGHILGLQTVAEYVEDADTLERLRTIGVDFAQGYFIAEPESMLKTTTPGRAVIEVTPS